MTCYISDGDEADPDAPMSAPAGERVRRNGHDPAEIAGAFDDGVDAIDMMIGAFLNATPRQTANTPGPVRDTSSDDRPPPRSSV